MFLLADYTFGQGLLTVLAVFLFAAWIAVLFTILSDLFSDHGLSGWAKAAWVLFLVFIPFLAALVYLIARGQGMSERTQAGGGGQAATGQLRTRDRRRRFDR